MNTTSTNGAPKAQQPAPGSAVSTRKRPSADPFFSGPKPRVPLNRPKVNGQLPIVNGRLAAPKALQSSTPNSQRSNSPSRQVLDGERVSGFSDPQVIAGGVPYKDYPVIITKRDVLDGLRYHILQIGGDKPIDIRNESEFPKPARLIRRDPRGVSSGPAKEEGQDAKDGLKPEEREELNRRKEQRQKEREANLAQIAPSQTTAKKVPNFKKKVQQVFRPELTEQDKKRIQLNYEEKLPWHLEDFESSKTFLGQNQVGSANVYLGFVQDTSGSSAVFRTIPIEKVYQFNTKRAPPQTMSIEEAEEAMKKRGAEPDWLLSLRHERIKQAQQEVESKKSRGLFSGAQVSSVAGRQGEEADLDFEEDFADDEEGPLFEEKDEDEKLAEKKIKEDLLTANIFDIKDIKEYDEAEEKERREEEAKKKNNRKLRKALEKRERNYTLASDSEYSSDTDSEEERERLEQERLNNVKKEEEAEEGKKSNLPSGTNTPSGRKEKHGTASDREGGMKKSISNKSLKRPGSPNLSDASGTDTSTRKKHKSRHLSSTQPTPGTSRPHSPANVPSSSALMSNKLKRRPGSGSDTEMTGIQSDREGAMSDSGRRRPKVGPSRQTSPIPVSGAASISQPASTDAGNASPPPGATVTAPTPQEIRDVINQAPGGQISIPDFLKHFKMNRNSGYVVPPEVNTKFTALMKQMTSLDKTTKMLFLKP